MNAIPELTDKQSEALDTLVDLLRQSRKNDPDARTTFLAAGLYQPKPACSTIWLPLC